jgi:hypothetical protein
MSNISRRLGATVIVAAIIMANPLLTRGAIAILPRDAGPNAKAAILALQEEEVSLQKYNVLGGIKSILSTVPQDAGPNAKAEILTQQATNKNLLKQNLLAIGKVGAISLPAAGGVFLAIKRLRRQKPRGFGIANPES